MPYPQEYQIATSKFQEFLIDVKNNCDFGSSHMAYTVAQGVLQAFRRRLNLENAIGFSNLLPVGLRALFVADWDPEQSLENFDSTREELINEFQSLRELHNFTYLTDYPAKNVYEALVKQVDKDKLDDFMQKLPERAYLFWDL
jgi:uncharacterized protein (DUF2267 family)